MRLQFHDNLLRAGQAPIHRIPQGQCPTGCNGTWGFKLVQALLHVGNG